MVSKKNYNEFSSAIFVNQNDLLLATKTSHYLDSNTSHSRSYTTVMASHVSATNMELKAIITTTLGTSRPFSVENYCEKRMLSVTFTTVLRLKLQPNGLEAPCNKELRSDNSIIASNGGVS